MNRFGTVLMTAYKNCLALIQDVNGVAVQVVDGKLEQELVANSDLYVVIYTQAEEPKNNKRMSASIIMLTLEIHEITQKAFSRRGVEYVSDVIMYYLTPSVNTHGLTVLAPGYDVTYVKYDGGEDIPARKIDANRFECVKTLRFRNRITQQ